VCDQRHIKGKKKKKKKQTNKENNITNNKGIETLQMAKTQ
jgi:hypothetical protein